MSAGSGVLVGDRFVLDDGNRGDRAERTRAGIDFIDHPTADSFRDDQAVVIGKARLDLLRDFEGRVSAET